MDENSQTKILEVHECHVIINRNSQGERISIGFMTLNSRDTFGNLRRKLFGGGFGIEFFWKACYWFGIILIMLEFRVAKKLPQTHL